MPESGMTRRTFLGTAGAGGLATAQNSWVELLNGKDLKGWRPNENKDSWKVVDGRLAADGPVSHLYYNGPVANANFRNFELEVEALAKPCANSGIYFHTQYQGKGWPRKGFEIQINNTATGEGSYRERKRTGSLYGIRNIYKQLVADDEWFTLHVAVRGKSIQVRLNSTLLVDYIEPTPPVVPEGNERERYIDRGTFALQCHDRGSKAFFRSVRVRPLPDDVQAPDGETPVADEVFRRIITQGARNIPMVDYHVHVRNGLTMEQALAKSRRDGIQYGVAANCGKNFPVQNDEAARRFVESLKGLPVFIAMQAEGREWIQLFSRQAAGLFDYVFTDSMTWTDSRGRRMRIWMPDELGTISDPQEFMDTLVARAVGILEREPIDIYVNPTFLPAPIAKDYDRLWTEERMKKVIAAAAKNQVAIEINDHYRLPSEPFLRMAKEAGCRFAFGTNNGGPRDLDRSEYGLEMVEKCQLGWQDFFVPGAWGPKAVERKGEVLGKVQS